MIQVDVRDAQTRLRSLVDATLAGQSVTITRDGHPVVDLVIHRERTVAFGHPDWEGFVVEAAVFDGLDPEIQGMFCGEGTAPLRG